MDSTHNTNKLKWYLSTLMVRDNYYSWIPAAFLLHNNMDSDIIAAALIQIKRWCGMHWLLCYILIDDSASKQAGVKKAFYGLNAGKQEVTHLLCIIHSDRTLKHHFGHSSKANILQHLQQALWGSFTKKGYEDNIQAAINASHDEKEKEYIQKEWFNTMDKWALYACQYSSLLL
jgi:hypothetical protein